MRKNKSWVHFRQISFVFSLCFFFFLGFVFYVLRLNLGWMRGTKLRAAAFKMTGVGSFVLYSNSNSKIIFFFFEENYYCYYY